MFVFWDLHHVDDGIKLCSAFDSVQVHRALNFKSVLTASGNRVVREKPGNFSCVTRATV